MKLISQILLILSAVAILVAITYFVRGAGAVEKVGHEKESQPTAKESSISEGYISIKQANAMQNVLWIDARSRAQWQSNGKQGSLFITLDPREDLQLLIEQNMQRLYQAEQAKELVVIYCNQTNCSDSQLVKNALTEAGFELNIKILVETWDGE